MATYRTPDGYEYSAPEPDFARFAQVRVEPDPAGALGRVLIRVEGILEDKEREIEELRQLLSSSHDMLDAQKARIDGADDAIDRLARDVRRETERANRAEVAGREASGGT